MNKIVCGESQPNNIIRGFIRKRGKGEKKPNLYYKI